MPKKPSGFIRLKQAASMTAVGSLGLLGIGSGRAAATSYYFTISVNSAISAGTAQYHYFSSRTVYASSVLNGTPTVSHNGTTAADGISDYTINGLNINFSGSNYTGSFSAGTETELDDAFDGYGGIFVDGAPYTDTDGMVDLTGTTVTTDPDIMPNGLAVSSQYHAFSDKRMIRIIHQLHNPTGAAITARATTGGNLGSDSNTYVVNTSNGNTVFDSGDHWVITSDNDVYGGVATRDPIITHVLGDAYGIQAIPLLLPGQAESSPGYISYGYDVTVNPGETQFLTIFAQFSLTQTEADTALPNYTDANSLTAAGLLINLPAGMSGAGSNWGTGTPGGPAQPVPFLSPMGIVTLTGILALITVRRSRKKAL